MPCHANDTVSPKGVCVCPVDPTSRQLHANLAENPKKRLRLLRSLVILAPSQRAEMCVNRPPTHSCIYLPYLPPFF